MKLLEINNLHTYFETKRGLIKAVNGVTLSLEEGRTLGIVGESGSGKSQTAMSILKLFEKNQKIYEGEIKFMGKNISDSTAKEMSHIRGNDISMIFQEPMTSLNPIFTVNRQISEVLRLHQGMSKKEAEEQSIKMLESVKIANPQRVNKSYPFELSGGMRQRVMIAMALACKPKLLIADEPTTALDVTIQAQILKLMNDLKEKTGTSIMLITHDLGVVAQMADHVNVMYAGKVVESAPVFEIFKNPKHPYTVGLMSSMPSLNSGSKRLSTIEGNVPNPINLPKGCYFADRCPKAMPKCRESQPHDVKVGSRHHVSCFLFDDVKGEE